jgi:hypothetical protein
MWLEMIPKVFKDRTDNEDAAWEPRVANLNLNAEEDSDGSNNAEEKDSDAGCEGAAADGEKDNSSYLLDPKCL